MTLYQWSHSLFLSILAVGLHNITLSCFSHPLIAFAQFHLWAYLSFRSVLYMILCGTPFFFSHTLTQEILPISMSLIKTDLLTPSLLPLLKFNSYSHLPSGELHLCVHRSLKIVKVYQQIYEYPICFCNKLNIYNIIIYKLIHITLNSGAGPRNLNLELLFDFIWNDYIISSVSWGVPGI